MIMLAKTALVRGGRLSTDTTSLYALIQSLGIASGLLVCLDAGDALSYDGSSQTWMNRVGSITDFGLGSGTGSDAADPTFNGTPGGLSTSEYFSFDGGDYFRELTAGWGDDEFHKNNATATVAAVYYTPSSSSAQLSLFGNDGTSTVGSCFRQNTTTRTLEWHVTNTSTVASLVSTATPTTNAWNFAAAAVDESIGTSAGATIMVNTTQKAVTPTYTSPSSSAASFGAQICARGNASTPAPSGTRLMMIAVWNARISAVNLTNLYDSIKTNRVASLP